MNQQHKNIITIIRNVVCGKQDEIIIDPDWDYIWRFAVRNRIEVIVYYYCINNHPDLTPSLLGKMESLFYHRVATAVKQDTCLNRIEEILQSAQISYAPQKGSILRGDYPERAMRYMSDIDIYINPEDRKIINQCLTEHGFAFKGTESGDEQFLCYGDIGIEFHGRLLYKKHNSRIENYPDWECVDEKNNRLTEEGFFLNMIGHAIYDFCKGGPGLRYVLDLYVYRHMHKPQPEWNIINERLNRDGIYEVAYNLINLSDYLFGNLEPDSLLCELSDYILAGGLHGDSKRARIVEIAYAGGKRRAAFRQLVRNRTEFENRYPWLKKYPFLLPVAYIKRLIKSIKTHRDVISKWDSDMGKITKKDVLHHKELLRKWGL